MALIPCPECGKEVSDKADHCIGCGAPLGASALPASPPAPTTVTYNRENDTFTGTKALLAQLCSRTVLELRWKVDAIDETAGLGSFTTGITWGSFSGVSGSILAVEESPNTFRLRGGAKQNVRGGQIAAINLFDEAGKKVKAVIDRAKTLCE